MEGVLTPEKLAERRKVIDARVKTVTGLALRELPRAAIYHAVSQYSPCRNTSSYVKADLIACFYSYANGERYGPSMLAALAQETTRLKQLKEARAHV